ncbi:18158_t:CDS:1, partial [Racocetra persica]
VFLIKQKNDKQSSSSTPSQTPPNNNQNPPPENPENSAEKIKEELKKYLKIDNSFDLPTVIFFDNANDEALIVASWEKTEVGRPKKRGKAKNISLTGMAASDIQEKAI